MFDERLDEQQREEPVQHPSLGGRGSEVTEALMEMSVSSSCPGPCGSVSGISSISSSRSLAHLSWWPFLSNVYGCWLRVGIGNASTAEHHQLNIPQADEGEGVRKVWYTRWERELGGYGDRQLDREVVGDEPDASRRPCTPREESITSNDEADGGHRVR